MWLYETTCAMIDLMPPPSSDPPQPEYLTRQEAANLLRVDVQTIDRYANTGVLTRHLVRAPAGKLRRTLFRADEVRGLIQREEQP